MYPLARPWCAELLGIHGAGDFGSTLVRALDARDDFVRAAAAQAESARVLESLVVHTVACNDNAWYREQLERIAAVTGGEHRAFD